MTGHVKVERHGETTTIPLCNPSKRNALSLEVLHELTAAFVAVGESDAAGVVLAAEGPVFSAGHNFADMHGASREAALELFTVCSRLMTTVHQIPQPVVARVHALATAAGCQLVATCDLAVAARSASFALPGGKGGLFCHTPLVAVARNLPPKRALEMALTGDAVPAEIAAQWGLVNEVVEDDALDEAVAAWVARATRGSRESKALGKRTFYRQVAMAEDEAYAFASAVMADAAVSTDAQSAIAAFLNKR